MDILSSKANVASQKRTLSLSNSPFKIIKCKGRQVVFPLIIILLLCIWTVTHLRYDTIQDSPQHEPLDRYNLPQLLNLSAALDKRLSVPLKDIALFPNSIASRYIHQKSICTSRFLRSQILPILSSSEHNGYYVEKAKLSSTLTIQFCNFSDKERKSLREIDAQISNTNDGNIAYPTILLVPFCMYSKSTLKDINDLRTIKSFQESKIVQHPSLEGLKPEIIDEHLSIFHHASNLAVIDPSAFGALAAVSSKSENGVFMSESHPFLVANTFRHSIKLRSTKSIFKVALDGMGSVKDSCCSFSTYGKGDGAKVACKNSVSLKHPCWILSLGCMNIWDFEADIIKNTECSVHVFDCTGDFKVPSALSSRVTFHKLCIGNGKAKKPAFKTYDEIVDIATRKGNLPPGTPPAIMKMDIEGWEYPVMETLIENQATSLPKQILMELHCLVRVIPTDSFKKQRLKQHYFLDEDGMRRFLHKLRSVGYELVHRADNPFCEHCSEVTLLHTTAFPAIM